MSSVAAGSLPAGLSPRLSGQLHDVRKLLEILVRETQKM